MIKFSEEKTFTLETSKGKKVIKSWQKVNAESKITDFQESDSKDFVSNTQNLRNLTFQNNIKSPEFISSKFENDEKHKKHKKHKHSIEYLRYKRDPILKHMLKYTIEVRDCENLIEQVRAMSLLKECIDNIWKYSPEAEPNFAKIIILLENVIYDEKWTFLNKQQLNCIIEVINMCLEKNITNEDRQKAFKILYSNKLDPFPSIGKDEDEDEDEDEEQ